MNIDAVKLRLILSMIKEDVAKLRDPFTIDIERDAICVSIESNIDLITKKLNDKQFGTHTGGTRSEETNRGRRGFATNWKKFQNDSSR